MKIGIDAQMLCGTVTGIERYTFELTQEIICANSYASFFLYAPRALNGRLRMSLCVLPALNRGQRKYYGRKPNSPIGQGKIV